MKKTVLILGTGQLAKALCALTPAWAVVRQLGRDVVDLTNAHSVKEAIAEACPKIVINAAAYTQVDQAESEPELAFAVNRDGVSYLATACERANARLLHVSTDYVFDGLDGRTLAASAETNPINVYGQSKLAGEQVLMNQPKLDWVIVRTAWVYSNWGKNFLNTMLRLMAQKDSLGVVSDQVGTPTSALTLARALWAIADSDLVGLFHWTDAGVASWYDFSMAILEEALRLGLIHNKPLIRPIMTEDFPTPAPRPACVLLDKTALWKSIDLKPMHWREALQEVLSQRLTSQESQPKNVEQQGTACRV